MKNICQKVCVITAMLMIQSIQLSAQKNNKQSNNNETCLQIEGLAVDNNGNPLNGLEIKLLKDNEEVDQQKIIGKEYTEYSLLFNLSKNSHYSIQISKEGYVSELISISTEIPDKIKIGKNLFIFEFEIELVNKNNMVDEYYTDFPIALISYNPTEKVFKNHEQYTKHIKEKMRCCDLNMAVAKKN